MRPVLLTILVLVALLGAYLAGVGITGRVISQSCCFGEECAQGYLCDAAEPILEQPAPIRDFSVLFGVVLLAVALLLFGLHARHPPSETRHNL